MEYMLVYLVHPAKFGWTPAKFMGWLLSHLICWQTRSRYSHAAIGDGDSVWEAVAGGVRKVAAQDFAAEYRGRGWHTFLAVADMVAKRRCQEFLGRQVGKPYDYVMVLRFLTHLQETRKSRGRWFCSELVFAALQKFYGPYRRPTLAAEPWEVAPVHLSWSPMLERRWSKESLL